MGSRLQKTAVRGLRLGAFSNGIFFITDAFARRTPFAQPGIVPLGDVQVAMMQVLTRTFAQMEYKPTHEVTAGMVGVAFMLHLCDEITLYEMVPSPKAKGMPWHYYEAGGDATKNTW